MVRSMIITKMNINGAEYIIRDSETLKELEELKTKLEKVEEDVKRVPKLQIIEVE